MPLQHTELLSFNLKYKYSFLVNLSFKNKHQKYVRQLTIQLIKSETVKIAHLDHVEEGKSIH